jgi:anti-sigma B factor antagonist
VLFALDVHPAGPWVVVAITGELELGTAPRLRQQVVTLVGDGHTHIVLDMSAVDFVDSIGLGVIVSALKRVRGRDGELVVAGASPRLRSLFELTRLDQVIDLYDSVPDVLASRPVASSGEAHDG